MGYDMKRKPAVARTGVCTNTLHLNSFSEQNKPENTTFYMEITCTQRALRQQGKLQNSLNNKTQV